MRESTMEEGVSGFHWRANGYRLDSMNRSGSHLSRFLRPLLVRNLLFQARLLPAFRKHLNQ